MLHAQEGRRGGRCARVGLLRLPHTSGPASQKTRKVITRIQSDNTVCHSLSHPDVGSKFAINLNFPLDPDMAFAVPAAGQKLNVRGHKCWPGALIASSCSAGSSAVCFALFWFTEQTHPLWDAGVATIAHRSRCGTGLFRKVDKTAFAFLPFEVALVWHGCYGWVAQQIDLAEAGHMWETTSGPGQMKDGFGGLLVTTACSHRSRLWWRHRVLSTCPVPLTPWQTSRGEKPSLSPSLPQTSAAAAAAGATLLYFFFYHCLIWVSNSFHYTQWTLWFQPSLFITISNYSYLSLLQWNRPGENLLSIDCDDSETGEWIALGYHSHLSASCHVSASVCSHHRRARDTAG